MNNRTDYAPHVPPSSINLDKDVDWMISLWEELKAKKRIFLKTEDIDKHFSNSIHFEFVSPRYVTKYLIITYDSKKEGWLIRLRKRRKKRNV